MVNKPIIFSGESVRAILDGQKTQSRRVIKPQPPSPATVLTRLPFGGEPVVPAHCHWPADEADEDGQHPDHGVRCPYGGIGSRLWVRETWAPAVKAEGRQIAYAADGRWGSPSADGRLYFHGWISGVTDKVLPDWQYRSGHWVGRPYFNKWHSSRYMPRSISRITLELTEVRVQRLQDITEKDAKHEGYPGTEINGKIVPWSPRGWFQASWDVINEKRGFSWESNCWVWCLTFKRVEPHDA